MSKKVRKEHGIANSEFGIALRKEIGKNLKAARLKSDLTPAQLAAKAGVSVPQIYNVEAGSCSPSLPVLIILEMLLQPAETSFVSEAFYAKWQERIQG